MNGTQGTPAANFARAYPPLVSIVMPAFNASRFIEAAIDSVQAQTYQHWQLIVIDDASTDATPDLVRSLAGGDPRIELLSMPRNAGPGPARNLAFERARGSLVAFLDSDDLCLPEKLEHQIRLMRDRDWVFSFHAYRFIDEKGAVQGPPVRPPEQVDYRALLKNTIIAPVTVMLDREGVGALRMPSLPQHEDLVLFYDILKRGIVAHGIPDDLARYRIVSNSASRNKRRSARRMWSVYRRIERLSLPDAVWCYAHYAWNAWWKYRR